MDVSLGEMRLRSAMRVAAFNEPNASMKPPILSCKEVYRSLEAWQGLKNGTPVSGAVMHDVQTGATEHDGDIRVFLDAAVYSNVNHAYFGFVILISIDYVSFAKWLRD
nr:hypothetical protein Itr_chr01CG05660 [Ipomoea trifida]